ncbi:MAG TPA: DUF4097 family beta strand repeat-containing protein [Acidobacteriaceae bacterium]|jgi:hypothetical protein|nr:DUF4097 family beta strand repeat-containing protein [Acidobacteriaceae bacterium]
MNLRFAAAALTLALTPAALFAAEGTFDRTLHVTGAATLNVSTGSGYIHITPGPAGSVHIIGHIHASSGLFSSSPGQSAREVADHPPITQNGNQIDIGKHTHYNNVSIDYVITVPRGTIVSTAAGSGDINVSNLGASLRAETGSGDIEVNDLTGTVALNTGSGTIHAMMNNAEHVRVGTGSGNIRLTGVTGKLYAETGSGDIEISGNPQADWKIVTGSGKVTLNTGNSRYSLDASTGSGNIHSDPPLTVHGTANPFHVSGDINGGGGPTVRVQTGSGGVRIH